MGLTRNTILNLLGQSISIVLAVATVPAYLHVIGDARFGVLSLLWLFAATMILFDLGMGQAVTQRLASGTSRTGSDQAGLLVVALLLAGAFGLLGAFLTAFSALSYIESATSIAPWLKSEVGNAVPWASATIPLATTSSVMLGALQARSRFLSYNLISILLSVLAILLPLLFASRISSELWLLAAAVLIARIVAFIALCWKTRQEFFCGVRAEPRRNHYSELVSFGRWALVSACVGPLMVVADRFLIGALHGAVMVSRYVVPFQLAERVTTISAAIVPALFPRLAGTSKQSAQSAICINVVHGIAVLTAPFVVCAITLVDGFLSLWISETFSSNAGPVGRLLLAGFWVNSLALIVHAALLARGRPDLIAKCHLAEVIPYAILLYLAISWWGIIGAAVVFSVRVVADFAMLSHLIGALRECCAKVAVPLALMVLQCLAAVFADQIEFARLGIDIAAVLASACWSIASRSAIYSLLQLGTKWERLA